MWLWYQITFTRAVVPNLGSAEPLAHRLNMECALRLGTTALETEGIDELMGFSAQRFSERTLSREPYQNVLDPKRGVEASSVTPKA